MIGGAVISGGEAEVKEGLQNLLGMGVGEVLVSVVHAGEDQEGSIDRTTQVLAEVSQAAS